MPLLLARGGWRSLMGPPRAEFPPSWCHWGCTAPLSHQTLSLGTQPGRHPSAKGPPALGASSIPTQPLGRDTCFPPAISCSCQPGDCPRAWGRVPSLPALQRLRGQAVLSVPAGKGEAAAVLVGIWRGFPDFFPVLYSALIMH